MALSTKPQDAISEVLPLVETYDELSETPRRDLLEWTRQTPLNYGAWKPFKKLFKTIEARVLAGDFSDRELLIALLSRIDNASVAPSEVRALKPVTDEKEIEETLARSGHQAPKSATGNGLIYTIGGAGSYYSGWRLILRPQTPAVSGLTEAVRALLSRRDAKSDAPKIFGAMAWETPTKSYTGSVESLTLDGTLLEVGTRYGNPKQFTIDVSDPAFPHLLQASPNLKTIFYMKRRARRLLRHLQESSPDFYWETLLALLRENGGQRFDAKTQWLSADALFGGSDRYVLKQHGRGPLVAQRHFWRHAREERAPQIWDAHRDDVRALFLDEKVPVTASAVAFNALRGGLSADEITALWREVSAKQLARFTGEGAAFLRALALFETLRRWEENGALPDGAAAAQLVLQAPARLRQRARVLANNAVASGSSEWKKQFAKGLQNEIGDIRQPWGNLSRRAKMAFSLLATAVPESVSEETFWEHLQAWLTLQKSDAAYADSIRAWIEKRAALAGSQGKTERLTDISFLDAADRDWIFAAFARDAGNVASVTNAFNLISGYTIESNELGWRYLTATKLPESDFRKLWKQLLDRYQNHGVYTAALGEYGLAAFQRVRWNPEEITKIFEGNPKDAYSYPVWKRMRPYMSPAFAAYLISLLPLEQAPLRVLEALIYMPQDSQLRALELMRALLSDYAPTIETLQVLVREANWQLRQSSAGLLNALAASAVSAETLRAPVAVDYAEKETRPLWQSLFSFPGTMESATAAIELLRRIEPADNEIFAWLRDVRKFDTDNLAPDFLAAMLRRSPQSLLEIVGRADADKQRALRELLLRQLQDESFLIDFWNAVWPQLRDASTREGQSETETARQRETLRDLVRNEEIARTFASLSPVAFEEFLSTDEAEHETLLLRWLDAHLAELPRDSQTMILAATCPLSSVHERALQRLATLGVDMSVALRLLESGLPPAMRAARAFFDKAPRGSEEETRYALALCDSPQAPTRAAGRDFLEARRDTVLNETVLRQLGENPHPQMQAWLAREYSQAALSPEVTADFDRIVLRAKRQARTAKESVKTRLTKNAQRNVENIGVENIGAENAAPQNLDALMELARGNVSRDREWALQQLALLKLSGAAVPDLQIIA